MAEKPVRYPELDGCRGLAIVMMIVFHFFVDLNFFGLPGPSPYHGFLKILGISTATLFILVAGISAHLKVEKTPGFSKQVRAFFVRGGKLILIGFGIAVITWWFLHGEGYVVFGILHLIGLALILSLFFHRFFYTNLVLACILLIVPLYFDIPSGPLWMAWTGMNPDGFTSIDYTPVIPWLAPFLLGLCIGKLMYPKGNQLRTWNPEVPKWVLPIITAGKNSLVIYLIHQPVLIILLMFFTGKTVV